MFVNGSGRKDASYQVSLHLAEGFQRRRLKCEKLTDDGCQVQGINNYVQINTYWSYIV
jgi:hypothetical protein